MRSGLCLEGMLLEDGIDFRLQEEAKQGRNSPGWPD